MAQQKYKDLKTKLDVSFSNEALANLFTIVQTKGKYEFANNRTLIIIGSDTSSKELYDEHVVRHGEQWTTISYVHYGTTDLWWLVCKFNGVTNPFVELVVGSKLKIPTKAFKDFILEKVKKSGTV